MALQAASRSGSRYPRWASDPLVVGGGHERALAPLLVLLLAGMVGGAIAGVLVLLRLALGTVENRSDCLLVRGVAGGNVEELLGGSWAIVS